MSEERRKILEMLAAGKLTSEEAERLLDATETGRTEEKERPLGIDGMPQYLYVRVEPKEGAKDADQVKVTVPLALIKAGINFISLLPKEARKDVEEAMENKGIDFDFKNLKPKDMDALISALNELEVDIETSENTVKIFTG